MLFVETDFLLENSTTFVWDINATTIIDQSTLLIGSGNESLGLISSLFIDRQDQLYILDKTKHRLLTFQLQEKHLRIFVGHEDGSSGSDASSFNSPNDIYISSKSEIYIADTLNHRIQCFPKSSTQGVTVFGTGLFLPLVFLLIELVFFFRRSGFSAESIEQSNVDDNGRPIRSLYS